MARIPPAAALVFAVLGCGRGPFFERELELDPCAGDSCEVVIVLQRAVDILFVIDDSGSMGDEQGVLASNFPAFLELLDKEHFGASYRIGITTTAAVGKLELSSCRGRLVDFLVYVDGV
jgi:hypothetical protein